MSTIGGNLGRTTSQAMSNALLAALRRTQYGMAKAQQEISTNKSVEKASDAPDKIAAILLLRASVARREQQQRNLEFAGGTLDNVDAALGDTTDLLLQAKSIASSQVGVGSDKDTRRNQAAVIDAQIQSLLDIANRTYQGVSLFGDSADVAGGMGFNSFLGGIRYQGTRSNLASDVGLNEAMDFTSNGQDAFGVLSSRVKSSVDLNPAATSATRLSDLGGATGLGIRMGSIVVQIDSTNVTVDLNTAQTLGDVVTRINSAIASVDVTAGSIAVLGQGLSVTAASGRTIAIRDLGSGLTAADLGIVTTATGGSVSGASLDPRLTLSSTIASLGPTIDLTSGIKITQGNTTKVLDLSGATTIQDIANRVDALNLGLRLEINDAQTGINLISEVSGLKLSIGENGGSTAADLGLQTMGTATQLSELNNNLGVSNAQGSADFALNLHDGAQFQVDIDGATTLGDVLQKIRNAALGAGLTVGAPGDAGTNFNVGLATSGSGIVIEDNTSGGFDFKVSRLGTSLAATDLGIDQIAGAGSTITGRDVGKVEAQSVFTHLIALRDALLANDTRGITLAGSNIESDLDQVAQARADVGVRSQRVQGQMQRTEDLDIAEKSALSNLQDADVTEVITRFTQLQQQLEASMRVGAQTLQQSLLDYLR